MIQTREYQNKALDGIRQQLTDNKSTLLVMATGTGKTVTFSQFANEMLQYGKIMVLAHREELVFQAKQTLQRITRTEPEIEMADYHVTPGPFGSDIVCSTIQTQIAGRRHKRFQRFNPEEFSLIIWDEAHHCPAKSYQQVHAWYDRNPEIRHLGVTATPDRADEKALGKMFETVAFEYGILEAINDGYLVPINQQAVYIDDLDFSQCRTTAGDLNGKDLAAVMEQESMLHEIAAPTIELTENKKTLIFTASLFHAERLCEILNRHRAGSAKWVHGGTPKDERANMLSEYADGNFQYLVNVGVATEGFDEPGIEVVVMGRPTKSRSLYSQCIGRGTRTLPGTIDGIQDAVARRSAIALSAKPNLLVLDFVGNSGRHRLVHATDILGGDYNDDVVERANKKIQDSAEGADVLSALQAAEKELEAEALADDARLRRNRILARARYSTAKVNPFNVLDLEPVREKGWNQGRKPTDKQVAFLQTKGVDTSGLSFTHASQIIDRLIKNRDKKLCTFKQAKVLSKFNYDAKDMSFAEASALIDKIAKNGWKRPA